MMQVKLRPLPQQIASVLVRRIAANEIGDGMAPSEGQICIEFGVSRPVAREALKILGALDMVDIAQGRRIALRPADEWDYMSPLLVEWLPAEQAHELLVELHEARVIIEPSIAGKAAHHLTEAGLARLAELLAAMAKEDAPDRYLVLDLEFHLEICRATRNRILERFMHSSRAWQSASRRLSNRAPRALPSATAQHRRIYEALAARDAKRATVAMREHLMANALSAALDEEELHG
jgi:GntR family galactonate operon transcriptional repressor